MKLKKLVGILMLPALAKAAPGELAQAPVTQAVGVKPNIQIILDDSGSMQFDDTLNKGVEAHGWEPTASANNYNFAYVKSDGQWKVRRHQVRERTTCLGFNVQAYNPDADYPPWPGYMDISSDDFWELEDLFYRRWDDANGNGEYDAWECGENLDDGADHRVYFKNMSAEQKQNYANWFHYYRTRMDVAQYALLNVVRNSSDRVGFDTINQSPTEFPVPIPVADMSDQHSEDLQDAISQPYTRRIGTPLRRALKRTGEYFKGSNSPILSAEEGGMCQQNYAILISDGYWNGSSPSVGDVDKDGQKNTLADVAMKYYDTDLKPGLENRVPIVPGVDENNRQHLVTYTVAFGVDGTLDYDSIDDDFDAWPWVKKDTPTTIDDMFHAAYNSKGKFLSARDPQALVDALTSISTDISSRAASTGSLGVSATDTSAGNFVIQTRYDPATWSGEVMLRPVGGDSIGDADWLLSERLALQGAASRNIYTLNNETDAALAFQGAGYADLSATQRADMTALYSSAVTGNQTQQAGDLIDYLRGDASQDGKRFRNRRGNMLGDIVSSSPIVVAPPGNNPLGSSVDGAAQYADFAEEQAERDKVIYVGANDGMLHAIDHASGDELFAFIPHGAFAGKESGFGLHQLAKKEYLHRYYVDASPTARDAYVNLDAGGKRWRTLLAGGMGAGGRSVYLLDVTAPGDFDTPGKVVKWEFTHGSLGYTFSEVQIARLRDGKWYAVFGNGYNASGGDGKAKLFLVNLEDPTDYHQIDTGVGHADGGACEDVGSDCNGLSSPELADLNGDGIVDWIYAGDLHGNVWAFDLQDDDDVEDISVTRLFTSCAATLESGQSCTKDNRQPITTKVALARNPDLTGSVDEPNVNVYWGTGQLLARDDVGDKTPQSFYSVLHTGNESGTASPAYYHDALAKRSYATRLGRDGLPDSRSVEPGTEVNYRGVGSPRQYGWYIELSDPGERLVNTPVIIGDVVAFNTTVPGIGGPCDVASSGWINALSLADGLAPDRNPSNDPDRIGDEQVFDVNQDGDFGADDMVDDSVVLSIRVPGEPTSPSFIGDTQYVGLANSGEESDGVETLKMQLSDDGLAGRAGWYQVR